MLLYILGVAICLTAILQMGMWITSSISDRRFNRTQLAAARKLVETQIKRAAEAVPTEDLIDGKWSGFREFYVDRLEKNVEMVTSVYLKPVDEKPIVDFQPGQHLSFNFQIPGQSKSVVRCYSLSTGPGKNYYRISVKAMPPSNPELPAGLVSNFINSQLMEGDQVQVKAPSGSFYLDEKSMAPVVLLAGGIGITPMLSMMDHLIAQSSKRLIVLFYGVRHGREHAFKDYFRQMAERHDNVQVVTCYSDPVDGLDQFDIDYQVHGFVSADLIRSLLPDNRCQFYMCGPPPFMQSVRDGLLDWNVPENRIRFEAFGPASIKRKNSTNQNADEGQSPALRATVKFTESGRQLDWTGEFESILEFAEANGVEMDSGCRAGSCGTCAAKLIGGKVTYPDGVDVDCGPDECLPCVAKPASDLELDA